MEDFANSILYRCGNDAMRAIQYLEHCIKACYGHNDMSGVDKFAGVRDFIENKYLEKGW